MNHSLPCIGHLVTEKPFNISRPNNDQVWACLQRCLSFEDPACRWERLQLLLRKQIRDEALKSRDISSLPLQFQDYLFSSVYGSNGAFAAENPKVKASTILNLVLALEDIERFTELAFESWRVSIPNDPISKELNRIFPRPPADTVIKDLAIALKLSTGQELWLHHARRAVPDWSAMRTPGPWSTDARLPFLISQFEAMESFPLTAESVLQARDKFKAALLEQRNELPGSFLPNLVLIVEGETESILLPHFADLLGYDFSTMGVMLISAGGGKQVARRYFELRDVVSLPLVLFADADAGEDVDIAAEALRENDRLHVWSEGEIEDTLQADVLVNQLNIFLQTSGAPGFVSPNDFPVQERRTTILNKLWRARGLGNFDKVGFAETVATNLRERAQVPPPVVVAIQSVADLLQTERGPKPAPTA